MARRPSWARPLDLTPKQLAAHLLAQPAVADRLAWRLCTTFLGEGVADRVGSSRSGRSAQARRPACGAGGRDDSSVRALLLGQESPHPALPTRSGLSSARCGRSSSSRRRRARCCLAEWTARLGQELFFPPNVGGWPGGRRWLSGRGIVARANFAAALGLGRLGVEATPPDLSGTRRPPGPLQGWRRVTVVPRRTAQRPAHSTRRLPRRSGRPPRARALIPSGSTAQSPCSCHGLNPS